MFKTIAVALSMYSAIPMPQVDWSPKYMRYAMLAFPLVGICCGAAIWLWLFLSNLLAFGQVLTGIGLVLAPILITGGIHLDGFCDTTDALASHAPRDKKLEILKDSHTGAFAIIGVVCFLLFYCAICTELNFSFETIAILTGIHVFSRCLSGFSVATFPCAKDSGLLYAFQDGAARKVVTAVLLLFLLSLMVFFGLFLPFWGLCIPFGGLLVFLLYRISAMRIFGGITGDLAGWFLCYSELFMAFCYVVGERIWC